MRKCDTCNGAGGGDCGNPPDDLHYETCPDCDGTGQTDSRHPQDFDDDPGDVCSYSASLVDPVCLNKVKP